MKTRLVILAAVFAITASMTTAMAQSGGEPAIRVLPTNQKGIVKVLFAYESEQPVNVKFYSEGELIGTDRIKTKSLKKGFSKRYDVSHITAPNFTIEIESAGVNVTYLIQESHGTLSYDPQLVKTTYSYALMASNQKD